jgi:hypothetical protein
MQRKFWIALALGLLVCLGIGYAWTARLDIPNPKPWWYGKDTVVRVEVWEPGKDMATVGMSLPKKALDFMHVLGLKSEVALDSGYKINVNELGKDPAASPGAAPPPLRARGRSLRLDRGEGRSGGQHMAAAGR